MSGKRKSTRQRAQEAASKRRLARAEQQGERDSIRRDMSPMGDPGHDTSSASMGRVKAESEEARHVVCPSCGFADGRHATRCDRA